MSATAIRIERTNRDASVLPFPRLYADPTETEALSSPEPQSSEFYASFRAALDAFVTEAYVRQLLSDYGSADSPFDAVYISALTPDPVSENDQRRIRSFSMIHDLSESISFNDGWDD